MKVERTREEEHARALPARSNLLDENLRQREAGARVHGLHAVGGREAGPRSTPGADRDGRADSAATRSDHVRRRREGFAPALRDDGLPRPRRGRQAAEASRPLLHRPPARVDQRRTGDGVCRHTPGRDGEEAGHRERHREPRTRGPDQDASVGRRAREVVTGSTNPKTERGGPARRVRRARPVRGDRPAVPRAPRPGAAHLLRARLAPGRGLPSRLATRRPPARPPAPRARGDEEPGRADGVPAARRRRCAPRAPGRGSSDSRSGSGA